VIRGNSVTTLLRRLAIGAVAICVPVLAGCEAGTNAPTLNWHPAANGTTTVVHGISISNVFVLGPAVNATLPKGGSASLFLGLINTGATSDKLLSISAPGTASSVHVTGGELNLAQNTPVYLTGPKPQVVLKDLAKPLSGGQSIDLILDFQNAGAVLLAVPVEPHAFYYATFSPAPAASAKASSTRSPAAKPSPAANHGATAAPSPSPTK
jgi:copper(I)-binding protein